MSLPMRWFVRVASCVVLACLGVACGKAGAGASEAQMSNGHNLAATGALLYERNCESCHGPAGQGSSKVPAILGRDVLSDSRFRNAQKLWDYVAEEMPKDNPGSLDITQYWEIVTFMVATTGRRKIPDDRLSESNASKIKLRSDD